MSEPDEREIERLRQTARHLPYPPTPDLSARVRQRLASAPRQRMRRPVGWGLALAALALIALLAVPEVRAGVGRLLRIGAVEIVPAATPAPSASSAAPSPTPERPRPTVRPNTTLLRLDGETTLEEAQERMSFPIKQPGYPADLGPPDRVFVQRLGDGAVILVWAAPEQPDQVRLALYQMPSDAMVRKLEPRVVAETEVLGQRALWTQGPYMLEFRNGAGAGRVQLVTGNVLIWTIDGVTYRLESGLALEEAVRIAESLR